MIPAQPILVAVLVAVVLLYFSRLRSKAADGLIILLCFGCASLVIRPNIATRIANLVGVGRGVDLILYLSLPGLLMMIFLLFARTRELNAKLTVAVREIRH
jgi:hypothetical protein